MTQYLLLFTPPDDYDASAEDEAMSGDIKRKGPVDDRAFANYKASKLGEREETTLLCFSARTTH
jgi:hypothetical protein